jgi:nitroreductase/NAD-dependent dihydropyrimidine dehydrogenase PreA subunit
MYEITINTEICKKDGLCATTCPVSIFQQAEKATIPLIVDERLEKCIGCGHCVAICPQAAISHSRYPAGTVQPIKKEIVPTYDSLLELMRSRRSKRTYRNKKVEKEKIEKILDSARFAPSGHNKQSTEFVVVQDQATIQEIGKLTADGMLKLAMPFKNPVGRLIMRAAMGKRGAEYVGELAPELEKLAVMYNDGTDIILNEPPVLLLFCADSVGGTHTRTNANITLHNAALAAETVGLGCFYCGFVVTVSERDDSIAQLVGLPETHKIYGALALGYPQVKFRNWPDRNPAKATWVGSF